LNAKREVKGTLRGFDQFMNIVMDETIEVVNGKDSSPLGTVVRCFFMKCREISVSPRAKEEKAGAARNCVGRRGHA
jgi:small nuclear ribonucleoprotein (snRNP)-like protein